MYDTKFRIYDFDLVCQRGFILAMPDLPFVYVMHNKILLKSTLCRFIRREGTVNEVHYDFHHVIYFTDDTVACI